jgi:hypothetical protein
MALYNVYAKCGSGDRLSRVYSFTARDDVAAGTFVTDRLTSRAVELWCYARRVARFEGNPPSSPARASLTRFPRR